MRCESWSTLGAMEVDVRTHRHNLLGLTDLMLAAHFSRTALQLSEIRGGQTFSAIIPAEVLRSGGGAGSSDASTSSRPPGFGPSGGTGGGLHAAGELHLAGMGAWRERKLPRCGDGEGPLRENNRGQADVPGEPDEHNQTRSSRCFL